MLSREILATIADCAREFDAGAVWLFGSALEDESTARDIDLAVEDLAPGKFFAFYARLIRDLSKPVDLVDLSLNPPIRHVVWEKGVRVYER
jgi:predicted nucleotidyltransferase